MYCADTVLVFFAKINILMLNSVNTLHKRIVNLWF